MTTEAVPQVAAEASVGRRALLGRATLLLLSRAIGVLLGVVTTVLIARKLGPTAFGTFALGLVLLQLGGLVTDLGMHSLLVRESDRDPSLQRALLVWSERVRLLAGALVALVLAGVVLATVDGGRERLAVIAIVAALPLQALSLGTAVMQQRLLLSWISMLVLVQSVVYVVVVGALYVANASVLGFALGYLGFAASYAVLVSVSARRLLHEVRNTLTWTQFRALVGDAVPISVAAVIISVYYRVDSLLVYNLSTPDDAGAYAVAFRFLDHAQLVPLTLSTLFLPLLTRRHSQAEPVAEVVEEYVRLSLLLTVPVVGVGMLAAGPIISLFGSEYAESVVLLRLVLPAFVGIGLGYVFASVAVVHRRGRSQLRVAVGALVANIALNLAFIPQHGARAAAIITVVTELSVAGALFLTLRGPCGLTVPGWWLIRLAGVTAVAGTAGLLLIATPLLAVAVFAALFASGAVAGQLVTRDELQGLLRRRTPRASAPPSAAD
ncbi:MAG: flippase [Mycobacteriales bacterium]